MTLDATVVRSSVHPGDVVVLEGTPWRVVDVRETEISVWRRDVGPGNILQEFDLDDDLVEEYLHRDHVGETIREEIGTVDDDQEEGDDQDDVDQEAEA